MGGLGLADKIGGVIASPLGFLPPRVQLRLMRNDDGLGYERAAFVSSVSRIEGIALSAATLLGLALKPIGVEIDHPAYDAALACGAVLALDTLAREFSLGIRYAIMSGESMRYDRPWGSAILSWIDSARHPEWYRHQYLDLGTEPL